MKESHKKHWCPHVDCGAAFSRPYRLSQHLLWHENTKVHVCKEANCNKSYTSKSHLNRHLKNAHKTTEKDVIYSCPTCLKSYSNRQNLKRHIKIGHNYEVPFQCDLCKAEFTKKHKLSAHIYEHTGVKSFSCDECCKEFVSLYDKKRHMRFHKSYKCDECSDKFVLWSLYLKHKKTEHDDKVYTCNDCSRSFKVRSHLVRHVKIHIKSSDTKKVFPCTFKNCERVYTRNSNLKQHIIIKHMNYRHECGICDAQLTTKAKLKQHLKQHMSEEKVIRNTERKSRKDKGTFKTSTAMKLAGCTEKLNETFKSAVDISVQY